MDGRVWLEALATDKPPEYIDSWDAIDGDSGVHPPSDTGDPIASATAVQLLVDLGYVEAPSEDSAATVANTIVQLRTNLALALVDGGELQSAADIWTELLSQPGVSEESRLAFRAELADCMGQMRRLEESRRLLEENLEESPSDQASIFKLAQLHIRSNEAEAALELIDRLDANTLLAFPTRVLRAQCLLKLRRLDKAAEEFQAVLIEDDENAIALSGMSRVALLEQEWLAAADLALRAVSLDPQLAAAHQTLGLALAELGQYKEAVEALEVSLRMEPAQPAVRDRVNQLRQEAMSC